LTGCGNAGVPGSTSRARRSTKKRGGLNLTNLSEKEQIEADGDYRICVRRGGSEAFKPKKRQRKMKMDKPEEDEP